MAMNVEQQQKEVNNNNNNNKGETLFWKLIRNKFIFYQILNKLPTPNEKETISKYDDIIHIDWIIENGYIDLLKYKVSRGDLLVCGGFHTEDNNKPKGVLKFDFKKIFKSIHSPSDIGFYNSLYSNYSKYIESTNKVIQTSIKTNNYIALSTFLNHNNKQFKILNYNTTTKPTPIEIVKTLFKQKSPSKKIIKLVVDSLGESFSNQKEFKLVFQSLIIMNQVSSIKTLNYILENSPLITKETKSKISIISFLEDKIPNKLNHLIHSCRLILNLNGDGFGITRKEFESIVTKLKPKQLLKSKVIHTITTNDQDIKKILKLFISVKEGIQQYTYIYNLMYNQQPSTTTTFNPIHFIQSLKFGDFNYFNNIINNEVNLSKCLKSLNEFKNKKESSKLLFKYCTGKQTEFINQVVGSMNSNSKITSSHYQLLIYLIIQTDNLLLLESTIKLIPSNIDLNSINVKDFNLPIQKYIYSTSLLNFTFNNFKSHFYLKDWSSNFFFKFNKLELFKQFEILNKQHQEQEKQEQVQQINFKSGLQRNLECKEIYFERLQLFKYIIENGYQYSSYTVLQCIKVPNCLENQLTIKEFDEIIIPIFKVIIGKNDCYFSATDIMCSKRYRKQYIKFLDWVEDSSTNESNSVIYNYGVSSKPNYYKLYSRPITASTHIDTITAFEIGRVGDLSSIESCYNMNKLSVYIKYTNTTSHVGKSCLLDGAAKYGRLNVIEYFYSKDSNDPVFTETTFIKNVIESNHFHIFDYLLENVNSFSNSMTKDNFKDYCISENSIFYKKYINYFK